MYFVILTYMDGTKVRVNMHQVVAYEASRGVEGTLVSTNSCQFVVKETALEITSTLR